LRFRIFSVIFFYWTYFVSLWLALLFHQCLLFSCLVFWWSHWILAYSFHRSWVVWLDFFCFFLYFLFYVCSLRVCLPPLLSDLLIFTTFAGSSGSFGRLACHQTPVFSLYASPNLCWVLVAPLGGWLVTLISFSPMLDHWEFSTESSAPCPTPAFQDRFSLSPPPPLSVLDYSLLFIFFNFAGVGRFNLPRGCTGLFSPGWVGELHVVHGTHTFCSFT
jgi:hypothetical protein